LGSGILHDTSWLGLDAIYPTFLLALVMFEVRDRATWISDTSESRQLRTLSAACAG